jgi:hypothetical protein
MNNTFSIRRFGFLFKKTIAERTLQTVGVIGLLLVLSLILYAAAKELIGYRAAQSLTFIWGFAGGGCFLASFAFGYFNTNSIGSSYLTLPASYLEKWLCGILICILFATAFLVFYHLMDMAFVAAYLNGLDKTSLFYKQQYESLDTFDLNGRIAWKVYSMFLILTGSMLTGAFYFNKAPFIKTAISICIVFLFLFGLNWMIAKMLFGDIVDAGLYNHVTVPVGKEEGVLLLPSHMGDMFRYSTSYIIPVILWFLPLLRLREKEF